MKELLMLIAAMGAIGFLISLFTSTKSDPKERLSEAADAAAGGAVGTTGCILGLVLQALPMILGFAIIGMILKSCS